LLFPVVEFENGTLKIAKEYDGLPWVSPQIISTEYINLGILGILQL
jgi:hypothetical protein